MHEYHGRHQRPRRRWPLMVALGMMVIAILIGGGSPFLLYDCKSDDDY